MLHLDLRDLTATHLATQRLGGLRKDFRAPGCSVTLTPANSTGIAEILSGCAARTALIVDNRTDATAKSLLAQLNRPALVAYVLNGSPARLADAANLFDFINLEFLRSAADIAAVVGRPASAKPWQPATNGKFAPKSGITRVARGLRGQLTSVSCVPRVCFLHVGDLDRQLAGRSLERGAFYEAARAAGTDKVTHRHEYHRLYEPWLEPRRGRPLSMLEIGLGCGSGSGSGAGTVPGRSAKLWSEYLPLANVSILEFGQACTNTWRERVARGEDGEALRIAASSGRLKVVVGSQSDPTALAQLTSAAPAGQQARFEVVIDDGGHENRLMLPSFYHLFPYVAPSGLYFIEDMMTSWKYRDAKPLRAPGTSIHMVKSLLPMLQCEAAPWAGSTPCGDVALVQCMLEHCVVLKRPPPSGSPAGAVDGASGGGATRRAEANAGQRVAARADSVSGDGAVLRPRRPKPLLQPLLRHPGDPPLDSPSLPVRLARSAWAVLAGRRGV